METRASRSISASPAGLKRLEEKRRMKGQNAATIGELAGVSRSTTQKFFNGKSISVENFQALCEELGLDWKKIAELEELVPSVTNRKRVAFVIEGSLDDLDPTKLAKLQAMVRSLQQLTGDASMTTVEIEEGSIRLILEGSEEGIEKLKQLFNEGELDNVLGTSVRAVEPIEPDVLNMEEAKDDCLKASLISMIQSQNTVRIDLGGADLGGADLGGADLGGADLSGANLIQANLREAFLIQANLMQANLMQANFIRANLIQANLRGADLRGADLRGADLIQVNFIRANLKGANLRGADLRGADLNDANLIQANLRGANLREADLRGAFLSGTDLGEADLREAFLSETDLSDVIVENSQFGEGIGLTEDVKRDLKRRGAIFNDSTGDREFIFA